MEHMESVSSLNYAVVDLETTGFDQYARIVEIAVILLDGETLEEISRYETVINPESPNGASNIHFITDDMLLVAPSISQIQEDLFDLLDGSILVGYHVWFDAAKLKIAIEQLGGRMDVGRPLDVAFKDESLMSACKQYNIEPQNGHWHRAIIDAECTKELFLIAMQTKQHYGEPCEIVLPYEHFIPKQRKPTPRELCWN